MSLPSELHLPSEYKLHLFISEGDDHLSLSYHGNIPSRQNYKILEILNHLLSTPVPLKAHPQGHSSVYKSSKENIQCLDYSDNCLTAVTSKQWRTQSPKESHLFPAWSRTKNICYITAIDRLSTCAQLPITRCFTPFSE